MNKIELIEENEELRSALEEIREKIYEVLGDGDDEDEGEGEEEE